MSMINNIIPVSIALRQRMHEEEIHLQKVFHPTALYTTIKPVGIAAA